MLSIGGLIWRGSIVLSIAMMALISLNPSVAVSTDSHSGTAKKPAKMVIGTPAGRLVRCSRMLGDRNPDPLMNVGPFFCWDDQAKWLCIMPKCFTQQKKSVFPLFYTNCETTVGPERTGLRVLAVHFQELHGKRRIAVQGWEAPLVGPPADEPGNYICTTTPGERPCEFPKKKKEKYSI
ncbi:hypothetical protein PSHT_15072 [Puccinia striiformis]|uniref:Secreted protein n=1 Tax=Puccinia striiformis TaxID=27350 RepID=A0A2S4UH55_9BASI|nr:hypothetical protein PSHT_15072 [Puccinia striiformis]